MLAFHREWKKLVNVASTNKSLIAKTDVDNTLRTSDYAFLLVVLDHHIIGWKTEYDANPDVRTKGQKQGALKLDDAMELYTEWGDRVQTWKKNKNWDAWLLKAQYKFLSLDDDGGVPEGFQPPPEKPKRKKKGSRARMQIWKD